VTCWKSFIAIKIKYVVRTFLKEFVSITVRKTLRSIVPKLRLTYATYANKSYINYKYLVYYNFF